MALYTSIHLHNVSPGNEQEYANWFDGEHQTELAALRGYQGCERYEVSKEQIMPDIAQPWRFLSVYDFDTNTPEIDIPALGPLLANARDKKWIAADTAERIYSYKLLGDWKASPNWQQDQPLSGVSIILGNYVAGRYEEYQHWYENIHSVEVINVPGHVAMKRGELSLTQVEPRFYCPGNQLVLCAHQTDDLLFTLRDFSARARGVSPSGIAMQARSESGSFARTVHYFNKVSGNTFWPGGIAYAGDLSPYRNDE
ncbi:MAG: hypothetical protein JKY66_02470 [Spongiibacteraceae bacterium]|nr:hypothetical protein [Spongiibacteraceae bacterium]MBN4055655.1 hypothetical protein [bacterium AH-315-K03]